MKSAYNAAIACLSEHIMQGKNWLTILVQEYYTRKAKYFLKKKLILF